MHSNSGTQGHKRSGLLTDWQWVLSALCCQKSLVWFWGNMERIGPRWLHCTVQWKKSALVYKKALRCNWTIMLLMWECCGGMKISLDKWARENKLAYLSHEVDSWATESKACWLRAGAFVSLTQEGRETQSVERWGISVSISISQLIIPVPLPTSWGQVLFISLRNHILWF